MVFNMKIYCEILLRQKAVLLLGAEQDSNKGKGFQ